MSDFSARQLDFESVYLERNVAVTPALDAHTKLRATLAQCSWASGWRSLLIREYLDRPNEEQFTTAATPDHLFVLVVGGSCRIESFRQGNWHRAAYTVGSLAMTPPGTESTLRWRSSEPHRTLQLHLPFELLKRQSLELWDQEMPSSTLPALLSSRDPLISSVMISLSEGLKLGLPNLYAENAAELLGIHLLLRHCKKHELSDFGREDRRLDRVIEFMRANLADDISLQELAKTSGLSRFHLLRLFKRRYGRTPLQFLTQLRMETAKGHLIDGKLPISLIATLCGYGTPANFATAFRRTMGAAPRDFLP